jgi:predicted alpha/beta-hydrolase family hydrolase
MSKIDLLFNGSPKAATTIAIAHGAGAPMDTAFMETFASGLGTQGFRVVRFEFPYMVERRENGKKRPPNPTRILLETWAAVIAELGPENLIISGKSMGGRIASMVADKSQVKGLVCLGYPFHPSGKPKKLRIAHLQEMTTPALFLQGERDSLGNMEDVAGYLLSTTIKLHWLEDGDHSFKPRKKSGRSVQQNWDQAIDVFANFVTALK